MIDMAGLNAEIEALLTKRGADKNVQFVLGVQNDEYDERGEYIGDRLYASMNRECGSCGALMAAHIMQMLEENILNGRLHVHAMPEVYARSEIIS